MRNFRGIIFTWTQTYREIFKSAVVYLQKGIRSLHVGPSGYFHIIDHPKEDHN